MATSAFAHPVAFEGSTQVMATYAGPMSSFEAYYTYAEHVALGIDAEYLRLPYQDLMLASFDHNWLVQRWNGKSSQGNFYAGAGAGVAWSPGTDESPEPYGRIALQADYETLWIYTALKTSINASADWTHAENTLSLGFAPYAHDYNRLATWIIVDFAYVTELDDHIRIIPKIRLFKSTWFLEAGISLDGDPLLSAMIHF